MPSPDTPRLERSALRRHLLSAAKKLATWWMRAEVLPGGARATPWRVRLLGRNYFIKAFQSDAIGRGCFENEMLSQSLFRGRRWRVPSVGLRPRFLISLAYDDETRLDRAVHMLGPDQRERVAQQALRILLEIFLEGYAHCDFHARNLYLVDGRLRVTDFEAMQAYQSGNLPAFPLSYDLVGKGLPSPYRTGHMCYTRVFSPPIALEQVLKVPLSLLLRDLEERLRDQVKSACADYRSGEGRHVCCAQRIYTSFTLPYLEVSPSEAQRDSGRRLERFRIGPADIGNKTVLDLGSHVGGMLFALHSLRPHRAVGVEYDAPKVSVAQRVAAYNGLNNATFRQADIDKLRAEQLGGPFDVVFCLGVETHIRDKPHLYRLLGDATAGVLYFEGNSTTDPLAVRASLERVGFRRIEYLGRSDDDCLPSNNCRPLLVARKS